MTQTITIRLRLRDKHTAELSRQARAACNILRVGLDTLRLGAAKERSSQMQAMAGLEAAARAKSGEKGGG